MSAVEAGGRRGLLLSVEGGEGAGKSTVIAAIRAWLEAHGRAVLAREPEALARAVERSVEMKAEIVIADEREAGRRAGSLDAKLHAFARPASQPSRPRPKAIRISVIGDM